MYVEQCNFLDVISINGCSPECAVQVHSLLPGEIVFFHNNFNSRLHSSQNQWILEFLTSNCSRCSDTPTFNFMVCGKKVCRKLWMSVLGVSQARFYRIRSLYLEGKVTVEIYYNRRKMSVKSNEAVAWMGNYFDR